MLESLDDQADEKEEGKFKAQISLEVKVII